MLTSVPADSTYTYEFLPGATGMMHLDARAGLYEMYKIRGVRFTYRPAVGTTTNGEVLLGIDFDSRDTVATYEGTAALQPKSAGPVWRAFGLSVPPKRAMKQRWLLTSNLQDDAPARGAFTLQVTNTAAVNTGTIWCEYMLEFVSPRVQTRPVAISQLTVLHGGGSTIVAPVTLVDATQAPQTSDSTFYAMCTGGYDFSLLPGYSKELITQLDSLPTVWSRAQLWRITGPVAKTWFGQALSPATGGYALATALSTSALKALAGVR
jgi:hypothetical protein